MQTLIIGGGLAGLATAQVLVDRGESVRVLEAREGVALETSFANAGMLTPSLPEPWNGPGVHRQLAASLFGSHQAVRIRWRTIPSLARWGVAFLKHSSQKRFQAAVRDNFALARLSREKTLALVERFGARFSLLDSGTLCVFRSRAAMFERGEICKVLEALGLDWQEVGRDEIVALEPALAESAADLAFGMWFPGDAVGDAHLFCRELAAEVTGNGGEIDTGMRVSRLLTDRGKLTGVTTNRGNIDADRVIVAAGVHSAALLEGAGLSLPVQPAKGYSLTFDCNGIAGQPDVVIADEAAHAVISPFAGRIRVTGSAEFAGFDHAIPPARLEYLFSVLQSLLPGFAAQLDRSSVKPWAGLRPMSSDGRPHIGPSVIDGLFVNAGHGALGWTLAMGSAHLLADQILGHTPAIDHRPFLPNR